jgi:hypothetical protein
MVPEMPDEENDEVSELEGEVEDVLHELSNLELQFSDLLKPKLSTSGHGTADTNYLVAVRRFQNGMRVSLLNGAETGNKQTFLEGFNFYEGAITILKASGDSAELQQCVYELIQTLLKIIAKASPSSDEDAPYGPFFLYKSCQYLANIYESNNDFELALKFHDRAASFSKGIVKELELLQKFIDALLGNDLTVAQDALNQLEIKHISTMGKLFYEGFSENNLRKVQNAQNLLQTLSAQRNLPVSQILSLTDKLIEAIQPKLRVEGNIEDANQIIAIPAPTQSIHLTENIIDELRTMLKEGIQQLKSSRQGPEQEAPVFDASKIVSEIKNMISEEIKSISSDIVNQIVNKLPVGLPTSPRAYSGGQIADSAPEIKVVGPASDGERQPRPKLSDMINSIIVSE